MFDTHTHCYHSHDSKESPRDMIKKAIDIGLEYIAFTDHFDGELTLLDGFDDIEQINLEKHFLEIAQLKDEFKDRIQVGVGIECGFMKEADRIYAQALKEFDIDIVINSVHTVEYEDCYLPSFFQKRTKAQAYSAYLKAIRDSLDSPYQFDSIGHIGYIMRKSIYDDKMLRYDDFSDILDDILKNIISKNKALEVNSHGGKVIDFLPTIEILKRYKELGGELLTFGSDSHNVNRIAEKYSLVVDVLKDLGFEYLFKYLAHKPIAVKL